MRHAGAWGRSEQQRDQRVAYRGVLGETSTGDTVVCPMAGAQPVHVPRQRDFWSCVPGHEPKDLSESEYVGCGAGFEEGDFEGPLAYGVVLAHELVQPPVAEQAVSVLVDVHTV